MNRNNRVLIIGVLCFLAGSSVKGDNEGDWGNFNGNDISWNFPDNNEHKDTIDIDAKPMGSVYYGSGSDSTWDRQYDDTEVDEVSGDDADGSGYTPEDSCLRLQQQMQNRGLVGVYIPRCTEEGDFEKMQCHGSLGQCWCVDKAGREIPGTRTMAPERPTCETPAVEPPKRRPGVETRPDSTKDEDIINLPKPEDNLPDTHDKNDMDNSINAMPDEGNIDIQTLPPPDTNQVEGMMSSKGEYLNSSAVMKQPGILAGIIGGAVIGLLCAVLLVMFIVYRMRKKDEGSYALDEKRSPSHHTYQRANTREFYA